MSSKNPKKKKRKPARLLAILLYLLAGGASALLMLNCLTGVRMWDRPWLLFLLALVWMYAAMLLQLIIHEAGHLVFGLLTGYRFSSFRIFSLMWVKQEGRVRLKRLKIPGTGGQCLMAPPDVPDGEMPVVLYNLGGVLMNLITAAVFAGIALLLPPESFGRMSLLMLTVFGVTYALINGLPLDMGPVSNDGRNTLALRRHPETVRDFRIQLQVMDALGRGLGIRDMPEEWFTLPPEERIRQSPLTAATAALASWRLMVERRFPEAAALLDLLMDLPDVQSLGPACDRICLELMGENRPEVLEKLDTPELQKFMKSIRTSLGVIRTEYALALLRDRDPVKAEGILARFEKAVAVYPYPREAEEERALTALAREKYEQMKSPEAAE